MEDEVIEKPVTGTETSRSLDEAVATRQRRLSQAVRELLLRGGPLIALILLAAYLSFATPHFLTLSNLINVTRQSAITAILAVGQTLVILTAGIDLSVGAIAALSASVSAVLMTQRVEVAGIAIGPINFWLGFLIALVIGTLAGMLNGLIITRGRIPDFIATLGTLATLRGVALLVTGGFTGSFPPYGDRTERLPAGSDDLDGKWQYPWGAGCRINCAWGSGDRRAPPPLYRVRACDLRRWRQPRSGACIRYQHRPHEDCRLCTVGAYGCHRGVCARRALEFSQCVDG